ncbi:MAG TPA: bifunctional demethylmenaquinone methyltransferase/2-methoxy-6-polyprenyl-1,4-benzoquinol methylase UbiE [Pyrinomonadaceae bacterium]|nr:bifunctional demethylmenaquinone methyltransferase/2-methoxy-6-polyprenyl-1,4-benzoquinol methylase UbiE [Pyrinomonadaceae bacterium]
MSQQTNAANDHAGRVREMFATIATRYDFLNHLLSGNVDRRWRRLLAERVVGKLAPGSVILDVACGTGDLSLELFETTKVRVVGTDFCGPMLDIAAAKVPDEIKLVESDALNLPFREGSFDLATIAFGLRNLSSVDDGLVELHRILKPGGWVAVLEFSQPSNPLLRSLFGFYFHRVLPLMGGVISGSLSAYTYLPKSVQRFPDQNALVSLMSKAGFTEVGYENLTGGIAAMHFGRKGK